MRILITGGSGFIGTHLINRLLNDGHEVYNLDKIPSPALPDHRQKIIDILDIDIKDSIFNNKDFASVNFPFFISYFLNVSL